MLQHKQYFFNIKNIVLNLDKKLVIYNEMGQPAFYDSLWQNVP